MENLVNGSSSFLSVLGLIISLISLSVSYLSYQATKKATVAAERSAIASERSATAAEKSLVTTRPFIKLSNPVACKNAVDTVEISVQVTNFGTLTAEVVTARVNTINLNGENYWHEFNDGKIILYPGDTHTISIKPSQIFTLATSNVTIDYLQVDPGAFRFEIIYCARNDPEHEFTENVSFPKLQWTRVGYGSSTDILLEAARKAISSSQY